MFLRPFTLVLGTSSYGSCPAYRRKSNGDLHPRLGDASYWCTSVDRRADFSGLAVKSPARQSFLPFRRLWLLRRVVVTIAVTQTEHNETTVRYSTGRTDRQSALRSSLPRAQGRSPALGSARPSVQSPQPPCKTMQSTRGMMHAHMSSVQVHNCLD